MNAWKSGAGFSTNPQHDYELSIGSARSPPRECRRVKKKGFTTLLNTEYGLYLELGTLEDGPFGLWFRIGSSKSFIYSLYFHARYEPPQRIRERTNTAHPPKSGEPHRFRLFPDYPKNRSSGTILTRRIMQPTTTPLLRGKKIEAWFPALGRSFFAWWDSYEKIF